MEPAFARRDLSSLREEVPAAGPTDDDPAGGRIEVQPALDADRRRRPASEMVFRAEGKPPGVAADGRADGASDKWAGDAAVAFLRVGTAGMPVLPEPVACQRRVARSKVATTCLASGMSTTTAASAVVEFFSAS